MSKWKCSIVGNRCVKTRQDYQLPGFPRYLKQPINAHFRQCSSHGQKRTKQTGTIFVASLIAKNRKIACENRTAGSAPGLAVESIMEHLVSDYDANELTFRTSLFVCLSERNNRKKKLPLTQQKLFNHFLTAV